MADYATNPRAYHDYEILDTVEAGLVLRGHEAKSVKSGKANIKGAYVKILNGEAWLIGAGIAPYQAKNMPADYQEQADRKLLLSRSQLNNLLGLSQSHGVTLVPLKLYPKRGRVKLLVGVARGKKKYDKRAALKKKDTQRAKERGTYDA
ncbi:MAG TPA: SsrA-binding protein SmpB [Candidatus Paceibacterota bacterium]|nr:SsrA-binding protein SmpB [Candidatus Paceibacterota bacterium]